MTTKVLPLQEVIVERNEIIEYQSPCKIPPRNERISFQMFSCNKNKFVFVIVFFFSIIAGSALLGGFMLRFSTINFGVAFLYGLSIIVTIIGLVYLMTMIFMRRKSKNLK